VHKEVYDQVDAFVNTWLPVAGTLKVADIGAYDVNGNLRGLFQKPGWSYTGFDLAAGPNVDVVLPDETKWPNIESESFDVVVTVSTLEHTRFPWLVVDEIARITKPDGIVCLTAPYAWPYHAHPIDCWRIYPDGMRAIMDKSGFNVLNVRTCTDGTWKGDTVAIGRKR